MPLSDPEKVLLTRAPCGVTRSGSLLWLTESMTPNYPADVASDMQLFVWLPCEKCGRLARLHLQRELKPVR
jgi:hypothetical protein